MHVVCVAMPDPVVLTGEGEQSTLILRVGLVRPSVLQILREALKDAVIPTRQETS